MTKLNVIVALATGVKSRVHSAITALHRESQKTQLYHGLTRVYRSKDEDGDRLPEETVLQQQAAGDVIDEARRLWTEAWDVEATLAHSNTQALADVTVDDETVITDVPVTYLLYLEKQLADVYTFIAKLPTLDPTETWHWDDARGCYVTPPSETHRTKKIKKSMILHPGTDKHPPQVQVYDEDVVEGYWTLVKFSGALPVERKREYLLRVTALRDAVKAARELANMTDVFDYKPADALLEYVLR